ncbi:MAG: hypothetical protein E2O79_01920 [Caldithrix sp.]|nr:MAG: hypothetical protein E2O79_01920 [Caldithrix sp.]
MDSRRITTISVSVVLHVLIFLLWASALKWNLFATAEEKLPDNEPLVFELQQQNRSRQVVEVPDDAKIKDPPEDPRFASDKNALARNSETDANLDMGDPFARGDFYFPELPTEQGPLGEPGVQAESDDLSKEITNSQDEVKEDKTDNIVDMRTSDFNRESLTRPQQTMQAGVSQNIPRIRYDNRKSRAPDMGGMSFNTYNWDFAPYMLVLKKKVQGNIFPPPAFTHMGLIRGETLLRFKIYPNGELRDLVLLEYTGHETLMKTSISSINISAPFQPLPADFPEPFLEVTAKFFFYIRGR